MLFDDYVFFGGGGVFKFKGVKVDKKKKKKKVKFDFVKNLVGLEGDEVKIKLLEFEEKKCELDVDFVL